MENSGETVEQGQQTETGEGGREFTREELSMAGPDEMRKSALLGQKGREGRRKVEEDLNIHRIPSGTLPGIEPGELDDSLHDPVIKEEPKVGDSMFDEDEPERYS